MTTQRYIRFQDVALQSALLQELEQAGVAHVLDGAGSVCFTDADSDDVMDAAHRVRDAHFRGYFLKWGTEELTERFTVALNQAGLPFFLEYHDSGTWFFVRRTDKSDHERLTGEVLIEAYGPESEGNS
jgi:hypothetical protein